MITIYKKRFLLPALLIFLVGALQAQSWQWAISGGGGATDGGRKACIDPSGNVIIAGYFASTSINLSGTTITNAGTSGTDIYIVKYDAAGNYLWSQRIGGTGSEFLGNICVDANGNVYLAVYFDSPGITISPFGVTNTNTTTPATDDILVAKFNSAGSILWMQKFGSAGNETVNGIAFSNSLSAIYIAGNYSSPSFAIGTTTLTNSNSGNSVYDMYVAKLNIGGSPLWAKTAGATNSNEFVSDLEVDAAGYPHVFGSFNPITSNTTTIGTAVLTSYGQSDVYIAKYSDTGVFQWAKDIGCTGSDNAGGLEVDNSGNIYVTGNFYGATMNMGTITVTNTAQYDAYIGKCNSSGTFQWGTKIGSPGGDIGNDLALDGSNNVYVTGAFQGTTVPVGSYSLTNSNPGFTDELFVVKYNTSGVAQWAQSAQGLNYEDGYGITADPLGNVYVTGSYNVAGPMAFGTTTLNSAGGNDMFVAKIGCASTAISGLNTVCAGSSATLTASGATSYTWSTGATTTSVVITPTASGTYSVSGITGSCSATASTFSVTLLPANLYPGANLNLTCNQSQVLTASCSPAATLVSWAPATNLSSTSVLNPTASATGSTMQYTVTATLNNGCVLSKTVNVGTYAPTPDICMVTVDSLGVNNLVFWDKASYPMLDSMIILRETSTNIFKRIGAVPASALSMFTDTMRSIGPSNGDPNISTYRYKIQMRDSCGVYSAPSLWHNTIYFTNSNGTFFWANNYTIEGSPLPTNPVLNYSLMVCINPTVSPVYNVIGVTAGNQNSLSDPNYLTYQATADWRVFGNLGYSCIPSKPSGTDNTMVNATKSRSNIQNNRTIGFKEKSLNAVIKTYPNPVKDELIIDASQVNGLYSVELQNVLGEIVYRSGSVSGKHVIDHLTISPGAYTVLVKQDGKTLAVKKIIVNK